jgi:hypothetical protein
MAKNRDNDLERTEEFSLEEAFRLMESVVIRNRNNEEHPSLDFGVVSGVLAVNEEIELVIKFLNGLSQFTKSEFAEQFRIYEDEKPF